MHRIFSAHSLWILKFGISFGRTSLARTASMCAAMRSAHRSRNTFWFLTWQCPCEVTSDHDKKLEICRYKEFIEEGWKTAKKQGSESLVGSSSKRGRSTECVPERACIGLQAWDETKKQGILIWRCLRNKMFATKSSHLSKRSCRSSTTASSQLRLFLGSLDKTVAAWGKLCPTEALDSMAYVAWVISPYRPKRSVFGRLRF